MSHTNSYAAICLLMVVSHGCGNPRTEESNWDRQDRISQQAEEHIKKGKELKKWKGELDNAIAEFTKPILESREALRLKRIDSEPVQVLQATYERGLAYVQRFYETRSVDDAKKAIADFDTCIDNGFEGAPNYDLGALYYEMYLDVNDNTGEKYIDLAIRNYKKALAAGSLDDDQKKKYKKGLDEAVATKKKLNQN